MRRPLLAILMLGLLATVVGLVLARPVQPHVITAAPPAKAPPKAPARAKAKAKASAKAGRPRAAPPDRTADAAVPPSRPAAARAMRIVGLGWDVVAPAVVANGGAEPAETGAFHERGLSVAIQAVDDVTRLGSALAQGGEQPDGADLAVLPLPAFAASYERLRALEPEVFFVTGWSRGREAVAGAAAGGLQHPAAGDLALVGETGTAATAFALLAFDLAGVDLGRVQLVGPDDLRRGPTMFHALDRGAAAGLPAGARVLLTSADMRRAVPLVAVAPRGWLQRQPDAARGFVQAWLSGVERLRADVPAAARRIASLPGAPEVVALLERLGQIEAAGLADNARAFALSGHGAVTVPALFVRNWRLWRAVGALTTSAPDAAPVSTATVAGLVRAEPARSPPAASPPAATGTRVLLAHPVVTAGHPDPADVVVADVGLCAGLFEGHVVRVSLRGRGEIEEVLAAAQQRFGIAGHRLLAGRSPVPPRAAGLVEILGD